MLPFLLILLSPHGTCGACCWDKWLEVVLGHGKVECWIIGWSCGIKKREVEKLARTC